MLLITYHCISGEGVGGGGGGGVMTFLIECYIKDCVLHVTAFLGNDSLIGCYIKPPVCIKEAYISRMLGTSIALLHYQ